MTLWLKARSDRAAWLLIVTMIVLTPLIGTRTMPVLRLGPGPAPLVLILPALLATGILRIHNGGSHLDEARSLRPITFFSWLFIFAVICFSALVWALSNVIGSRIDLTLNAIRNLAGYLGIGLIALRAIGDTAANASPTLYAITVAVLGSATADVWSWPLYESTNLVGYLSAGTLLLLGLILGATRESQRIEALRTTYSP